MLDTCKPTLVALPEGLINRFLEASPIIGMQLSKLSSSDIGTPEMYRLLGPLGELSAIDETSPFVRWFAKPLGCEKCVLLWWPKRQVDARYRRLLRKNETLVLISRAYSSRDRDTADLEAWKEVTRRLVELGGRDVTRDDRWIVRAKSQVCRLLNAVLCGGHSADRGTGDTA